MAASTSGGSSPVAGGASVVGASVVGSSVGSSVPSVPSSTSSAAVGTPRR